ncbi:hypothetical protein BCR33DRAFT_328847 [Rhizoclosmatium globosum]|uniref:ABC-type glycine betaine transport system substrate-binding domain-containing protein n=1 Tax=Rhizoclosmatium globosum TaxID=329046 RepID=A0A1Y2C4M6_9FUNG|nr:hypothetical protein BCR33DRAFT_328847 [Rhizoclosmatium globosum]|eukprot:ORY41961.1 hypothetical protein BCR33DRAFT_328847 [Rhizoclosmatium globosum]
MWLRMIATVSVWIITAFPTVAAIEQASFNFSAFNIDTNGSSFYNAPSCLLPNNNLGWNMLKNQDGSFYTHSKRPIILLYDGWDSSMLNAFLTQYILEAMGYRVEVVTRINYVLGIEFYNNAVDLELEIWPQDFGTSFAQVTQIDKAAINLGAIGYNGNIGLYVPSYLFDQYPDWSFDFWRFLLNPEYRSIFPASGTGPRILVNGEPECDGTPGLCMNGTYIPAQCSSANSKCIEMWHYDPGYSSNIYQRLIDGLNLPVTINFLSFGEAQNTIQDAIDRKKAILFYNWTPTSFVANNNFTKVLFPSNNPTQYAAFAKDNSKLLTTDPQSSILQKLASNKFVADFPELQSFATKYQMPDDQINLMLKNMAHNGWSAAEASCDWFKKNQAVWGDWVPDVPKSVVSCPVGTGRYLTGATYSCIACPAGSYNWIGNNTQQCTPCPNEFECPGGATVNVLKVFGCRYLPQRLLFPIFALCMKPAAQIIVVQL